MTIKDLKKQTQRIIKNNFNWFEIIILNKKLNTNVSFRYDLMNARFKNLIVPLVKNHIEDECN